MTLGVAQLVPARHPVLQNPSSQARPSFSPWWPLFASEDGDLLHSHYRRHCQCVTAFLFLFLNGAPFYLGNALEAWEGIDGSRGFEPGHGDFNVQLLVLGDRRGTVHRTGLALLNISK